MAAIDETTRGYVFNALHGEFPEIPAWLQIHSLTKYVADVLPVGDTSFVAFGIAALVLVVVMFRS